MKKGITFFEGQTVHAVTLAVLVVAVIKLTALPAVSIGDVLGISTPMLIWLCVSFAVGHQVYVWFFWRMELIGGRVTAIFGRNGFHVFAAGFGVLGGTRFLLPWVLAYANRGTLALNQAASQTAAVLLLLPAAYLLYSLIRYFGLERAIGIDHFDEAYRSMPFVREGIFRHTENGMYVYGFLFMWVPAFWFNSHAALVVAAFNHAYIWVHYYCTERPDIRHIYGRV